MSLSKPSGLKGCLKKTNSVSFNVRVRNCNTDREIYVHKNYVEVFVNEEEFSGHDRDNTQLMIIDIGCPRSLMGKKEYRKLLKSLSSSDRVCKTSASQYLIYCF